MRSASMARRLYSFTRIWFFWCSAASIFWRRIDSSKMSCTRRPTRPTLSAYVGPMPRPVVPMARLPRNRSVTRSRVWWYGATMWALPEMRSLEVSAPRASRPSISSKRASRLTTQPLPIIGVAFSDSTPAGRSLSSYFSPPTTTVWPALLPPLGLTT